MPPPEILPWSRISTLDDGDFLHAVIEDDGHVLADIGGSPAAELVAGGIGQVEVNFRFVGIGVVAWLGVANIRAAPDRQPFQLIPFADAALTGGAGNAREQLGIGGNIAADGLQSGLLIGPWAADDFVGFKARGGLDDVLDAARIVHTRAAPPESGSCRAGRARSTGSLTPSEFDALAE